MQKTIEAAKGSWKLAAARECAASALEAAGFDPAEAGEPISSETADKIWRMAESPFWDVPAGIASLARSRTLTRAEGTRVIRGAFDTWTDQGPIAYSTPPARRTFSAMRFGNKGPLADAGYIAHGQRVDPGRGRGKSCVTPRQAAYIASLAASGDYQVPEEHLALAMRGLLTNEEASRLISAVLKTYMGAYSFEQAF